MSAAAHLLRRRTSSLLQQQRLKLHALSIPFLGTPVQSRTPLRSAAVQGRKFSATSTAKPPEISAAEGNSPSSNRGLKVATAGAAILLLSSGAWYITRDEFPQVQHIGLPQIFHGRFQEEKAPAQIDEKSLVHVESGEGQKEGATEEVVSSSPGEALSHEQEQTAEVQPFFEVGEGTREAAETVERQFEKSAFPEPPIVSNGIPAVLEQDSPQHEGPGEEVPPPKESGVEYTVFSLDAQQESKPADKVELEEQSTVEILVDVVKDKVSAVKEFLFDEAEDVIKESEEAIDAGRDGKEEEIILIREKLREGNPEMFYLETDGEDDTRKDGVELKEELALLQMLESGSREYVDAYSVPSRLSASYLVQKGHEDNVKRYSEKEKEGEVQGFVEITSPIREEQLREESLKEGTKVAEEQSKVVGVDVLVGAIHTAEQLQAEVDGRTFQEQLHIIQESHKREVQDFQAKIVAYAEGTDQLEKELKREKEEAAAALKLQEQKAEQTLQYKLQRQEEEATKEKERLHLLEKALSAASLTREKADHLEDLNSVQLQVDALRTAFYSRSEEARISHTAHKLAMGAFALEDAIEKGEAVEKEAVLLVASVGGPGGDPLVDAVVSSLPSEVLTKGTGTRTQLLQKFTKLKGSLRELALMPSGGGGVFAHLLARLTANLKISEKGSDDVANGGIETVIGRVERLLAEEKLLEAAIVLETGAKGTAAEGIAVEWAKQARNRAIIEQGLQALKAHVVAVASGLS